MSNNNNNTNNNNTIDAKRGEVTKGKARGITLKVEEDKEGKKRERGKEVFINNTRATVYYRADSGVYIANNY